MNGLPYYKAYPRDFIEGTIGMSFELKGAYRLILDLIYMQGGALPDDARYISGLLGCSVKKWKIFREALLKAEKVNIRGDVLVNYRADKELETLGKLSGKQRENRSRPNKNKSLQSPNHHYTEPDTDTEKKEEKETYKESPEPGGSVVPACDISEAVRFYNETAARAGWPAVQKMTDARRRAVRGRVLEAGGVDGWKAAIDRAAQSDFLTGKTQNPFTGCGFDWICAPKNFIKIMEGNYDNRNRNNAGATAFDEIAIAARSR